MRWRTFPRYFTPLTECDSSDIKFGIEYILGVSTLFRTMVASEKKSFPAFFSGSGLLRSFLGKEGGVTIFSGCLSSPCAK